MPTRLTQRLKSASQWRLLWLSLAISQVITAIIVSTMSVVFRGRVTYDYMLTGALAAFVVGFAVLSILILFIKELRQIETTLRENEERFRAVVETANDAIIATRHDGVIVFWNRAAEAMFGYSPAETIGKPITLIISDPMVAVLKAKLIGKTVKLSGRKRGGREFPVELSLASWETSRGTFFTAIVRDITERLQIEEALRRTKGELERYTTDLERRNVQLQATTELSRAIAQIHDPGILLPRVTHLISQHFGFYQAGIFLIDQPSGYAVLRAASSPGGQKMLERQHKLRVGSEGIVGYVTGTGQPRIALDVGIDAVHAKTPELPETRSEMAVPLRVADEIIGALDVQSTQAAAFSQEDIAVLTSLADQISIAIQNAQLFQQTQAALTEAEIAYRRYLRDEWDRFLVGEAQRPSRGTGAFSHVSAIDQN